jgi:hypothetical protein
MARLAKSFNRREPRFKQQATVLVICEDTKSGKNYLEDAKVHFRAEARVVVAHAGKTDPRGIVEHAIARQKQYDDIYCVIDRDTHETFAEAEALAKPHKNIELIASHPCFEFWLLLHFKYSRKAYAPVDGRSPGAQMLRALKECEGMDLYEKGANVSLFDLLLDRLPQARSHAARAMTEALTDNQLNPSTKLHDLIAAFEKLSQPQEL